MTPAQTTPAELDHLAEVFRTFAEHRSGTYAPLYSRLATAIADDPPLLAVAAHSRAGQSRPDLLLAAIHDLLHSHRDHPATRFYPSLVEHPDTTTDPAPDVLGFCHEYLDVLTERVATRLVQTNEVSRAAFLTPALHAASRLGAGSRPLALIEVGASAGLGLLFDRYHYRYTRPESGPIELPGAPGAPILTCALHGPHGPPLDRPHPAVAWRAGIDLNPLDPSNPADRQWLAALTWPDHRARATRLAAALDLAASDPPDVYQGDAIECLPDLAQAAPESAQLVVYHCAVLAHMAPDDRARFTQAVLHCAQTRTVLWVQAEPRPDADPRRLRLTQCADGRLVADHPLGRYQPHGEWLEWTEPGDLTC